MKLVILIFIFLNMFICCLSYIYQHEVIGDGPKNISFFTSSDSQEYSTVMKPVPKFSHKLRQHLSDLEEDSRDEKIYFNKPISYEIDDGMLFLHFISNENRKVIIQASHSIHSFNVSGSFVKIDVYDLCYESRYLNLIVHSKSSHERINYIHCKGLSQSFKDYFVGLLYNLLPAIATSLLCCWLRVLFNTRRDRIKRNNVHEMLDMNIKHQSYDNDDDDNSIVSSDNESINSNNSNSNFILSLNFVYIYLLFIFFFLVIDFSYASSKTCDPYLLVSNQILPTINRDDFHLKETVEVLGHYNFKLPSTSFSTCIAINEANSTSPVILNLEFKYTLHTRSEFLYYTAFHEVIGASKSQCFGKGGCGHGKCGGIKRTDNDAQGELAGFDAAKYPGHSFCDSPYTNIQLHCGGIHLNDKGCLYHRPAHKPASAPFPVYQIVSTEPRFEVIASIDNRKITVGIQDPSKDINVIISGSEIANDISMNGKTFILLNGKGYFGDVSRRNNPVAGMVGDFQCNKEDFEKQRWSNCAIATDIVKDRRIRRNGKVVHVDYDAVECGAMKIKHYPTSPLSHGKNVWTVDSSGVWQATPNTHEPLDVFLEIKKPLKVTRLVKPADPEIKFIRNLDSCRSCLNESSAELEIKSLTNPGRIVVTTKDKKVSPLTQVFDITREPKKYILRYSTQEQKIDVDFFFNNNKSIHIKNELKLPHFSFFSSLLNRFSTNSTADPEDPEPENGFCFLCILKSLIQKFVKGSLNFWSSLLGINLKKWLIIASVCFICAVTVFIVVRKALFQILIKRIFK